MLPMCRRALVVGSLLALSLPAAAGTLHVDADLTTGLNDGSSWANAFQGTLGLQAALAAAVADDVIFVAEGTYEATDTGSRTVSFGLKNTVEVYGSFLGFETSPDERPPFGTAPSVLDGDLAGDDALGQFSDNTFHLVATAGTGASAVLDGFVVRGGAATGGGANNDRGGGILCLGLVGPTVRNCRFLENRATFGGGAGYLNNGAFATFTDCSFEDGDGGSFGGAFDIAIGGNVRFERCLFTGNTAARGGGLEIFATSNIFVNNCIFFGNVATGTGGGGGLWIGQGGDARVCNCTIVGNSALSQLVGGLRVQNAPDPTVANCVLWDNAGLGGAQDSANQVSGNADVTWSIVEGGFAGTGNLGLDPQFANIAAGDVTPTTASPGIDAGSNAEVEPGTLLDFALHPRFADVLGVADTGAGDAPVVDIGALEFESVWLDLGQGLAGTAGAPVLILDGPLTGASLVDVSLSNAAGSSAAWLVVGLVLLEAPFKGGVMVPDVDFLLPGLTTPAGTLDVSFTWPTGAPAGTATFYQHWVQDAGGPKGFAASHGVQGTTP